MGLYISQIESAEKRYENNAAQRKRRKEGLRKGDWRRVDSNDRIRTRAASLGLDDLVERVSAGGARSRVEQAMMTSCSGCRRDSSKA